MSTRRRHPLYPYDGANSGAGARRKPEAELHGPETTALADVEGRLAKGQFCNMHLPDQ